MQQSAFAAFALYLSREAVNDTRRQANIAQAALVAADRPWLELVGLSVDRMEINPIGVTVDLTVRIKNVALVEAAEGPKNRGSTSRADRSDTQPDREPLAPIAQTGVCTCA